MITTLENLTEKVTQNRLKNLAINIVKYQNFKTSVILKKIDNAGYSKQTLISYINSGIAYINGGNKFSKYGNIYKYIDEAIKDCVQPLTPAFNEKRDFSKSKFKNKNVEIPVQKVLNKIKVNAKQFQYAVKIENCLNIVENNDEAIGFNKCLAYMNKPIGSIVKVVIEECE